MGVSKLLANVKKGKLGKNQGISTGIPKLDSVIYGIQRKHLYTIGADTGAGKTSFALDVFLYNLIKNAGDKPISILYYSFEMASDVLYAKLLSLYIFDTFNVVLTFEDILSLTQPISDENEAYVNQSITWLKSIESKIKIYDKSLTPAGIYVTCKDWMKHFGYFEAIDEHTENYIDHVEDRYKVVILDHVGLLSGPGSKKEKIDAVADMMIYFRNKCDITGVFIQQLNRNAKGMDRKNSGYELVQLNDFKDSSGTTDASEVVIALFYPYREKIAKCEGYPIQNVLKKQFRLCQILKGRWGNSDVNIGVTFHGELGLFRELPKPEEINDYEQYLDLYYKKNSIDNLITNEDMQQEDEIVHHFVL